MAEGNDKYEIHRHQKNVEGALRRMQEDPAVCPANKTLISDFTKDRLARGVGKLRMAKVVYCMRFMAGWAKKPFSEATKADLITLIGDLENKDYKERTKHDFKAVLKLFFKWLKGNDEEYPKEVSWLKAKLRNTAHKLPEELLTEEEVLRMARMANHPRDKALILVLYESGCRIGELMTLRIKNILFDQYGAILRVTGKTGDRRVRIISSAPALTSWLQHHARADNPEATLWPPLNTSHRYHDHVMDHRSMYQLLKTLAERAGVKKRIYPHLFRHSRATALAGKLTEAQMKEYFGWTQSSGMASIYVHMSGRDVDNALLGLHGMALPAEKKEEAMTIRPCMRCQEKNSPASKFCTRCGAPMEMRVMMEAEADRKMSDDMMNTLMQNPEFKQFLTKKVMEMGLVASPKRS